MEAQSAESADVRAEMVDVAEQTLDGTLPYEETWLENARNVVSLSAEARQLRHALVDLLEWAERFQGGDPSLSPEDWYINRDFARIVLGRTSTTGSGAQAAPPEKP